MSTNNDDCLVKHAFNEQKTLNMNWYRRINSLQDLMQSHSTFRLNFPSQLRSRLMADFEHIWNSERLDNRKLAFYNSVKPTFEAEKYIDANIGYQEMKRVSQFRMSSHKYNIETGRYGTKRENIINRICEFCSTEDKEIMGLLCESPFFEPIIEDENHVLNSCPRYSEARLKLEERTKELIQSTSGITKIFQDNRLIKDFTKFIKRCHNVKYPDDKEKGSVSQKEHPSKNTPHHEAVPHHEEALHSNSAMKND